MIIHPVRIDESTDATGRKTSASALVEWKDGKHDLTFRVENEYADDIVSDRLDAFVVASILRAMAAGEDVEVRGAMSARLALSLQKHWMPIASKVLPTTKPVAIRTEVLLSDESKRPKGVAAGYSAGIDSFAVLHDYLFENPPPGYKITHFVFNNVGSHGGHTKHYELFQQRLAAIRPFSDMVGIPIIEVDSNLGSLVPFGFQASHVPRNAAIPLLLQGLIGRWYYASTYQYKDCFVGPTYDFAYTDPAAVHLLSTETLDCISSGCQYSRVEKTQLAAEHPETFDVLNVCAGGSRAIAAGGRNCSTCWKCCRTMFTLELLGSLNHYRRVFDLEAYKRARPGYLFELLLKPHDSFNSEIIELARAKKFRFPRTLIAAAAIGRPMADRLIKMRRRR